MVSHELTLSETPSIFYDQKWKALSCHDCKRIQEVKSRIHVQPFVRTYGGIR